MEPTGLVHYRGPGSPPNPTGDTPLATDHHVE